MTAGPSTVRRRERAYPARGYVLPVKLSAEERELLRVGAAAAGLTPAGFAARAALDAAVVAAAPVGARTALERLAGFQLELAAVRRQLDLLRSQFTESTGDHSGTGQVGEWRRRYAEAAEQLTRLTGVIHRQLGGGF